MHIHITAGSIQTIRLSILGKINGESAQWKETHHVIKDIVIVSGNAVNNVV